MVWPMTVVTVIVVVLVVLVVLALVDVCQSRHAVRRNHPVIGRLRYVPGKIGPELRQYIVTDNDEERPFSRHQRRWVYSTAGSGSTNGDQPPTDHDESRLPCRKTIGEWRDREYVFQPGSVVNISAMSVGSLSGVDVEALNRGAALVGCLHNMVEGGVSRHHRHGGDLKFQLGTGYFGARAADSSFDLDRPVELVQATSSIKAMEIKLSQGAKPGLGGRLPAAKATPEIADARGASTRVATPTRLGRWRPDRSTARRE